MKYFVSVKEERVHDPLEVIRHVRLEADFSDVLFRVLPGAATSVPDDGSLLQALNTAGSAMENPFDEWSQQACCDHAVGRVLIGGHGEQIEEVISSPFASSALSQSIKLLNLRVQPDFSRAVSHQNAANRTEL